MQLSSLCLSPFSTVRFLLPFSSKLSPLRPLFQIAAMPPHGPNSQGGRRGGGFSSGRGGGRRGGRGGGGGGGGRGGGGRGEQRWWDPVWRAERLRQQQAEVWTLFDFC